MLRSLALTALYVCSLASATAQDEDPFALLFGTPQASIETSLKDQAGADDLSLVSLYLRNFQLADSVPAFETRAGLCLVFAPFTEALEFPIEVDEAGAKGWFVSPDQTLSINFATAKVKRRDTKLNIDPEALSRTPEVWCLSLEALATVFEFQLDHIVRDLRVTVTPESLLPIEAKLERAAARRELEYSQSGGQRPDYEFVDNKYRWLSVPAMDLSLGYQAQEVGGDPDLALEMAGDFLKTTARLRTVSSEEEMVDGLRLTLSRREPHSESAHQLKPKHFVLGDASAPNLSLISKAKSGAGLIVSNRSALSSDLFDVTDIRGPLPEGWEAELYEAGQLVAFVTEPDRNGEYVFKDVTLRPGFNRFEVRFVWSIWRNENPSRKLHDRIRPASRE